MPHELGGCTQRRKTHGRMCASPHKCKFLCVSLYTQKRNTPCVSQHEYTFFWFHNTHRGGTRRDVKITALGKVFVCFTTLAEEEHTRRDVCITTRVPAFVRFTILTEAGCVYHRTSRSFSYVSANNKCFSNLKE